MRGFADEQEKRDARTAGSAAQDGSTWGGLAGTVVGGGIGALASIPLGFGATAPALVPAAAGIGGGIGSAIGGHLGAQEADKAEDRLSAAEQERERERVDEELYREAVDRFLAQG